MKLTRLGKTLDVATRSAIRVSALSSMAQHIVEGPSALERRLVQLENQIREKKERVWRQIDFVASVLTFGLSIKARRWLFSELSASVERTRTIRTRATRIAMSFSRKTFTEMRAERDAIRGFLGRSMRVWETKDSGPAPI